MTDQPTSQIDRLKAKKAQLDARIKQLEARTAKQARAGETKRLILVGRCAEQWAAADPAFAGLLRQHLDKFATRAQDRAVLGLA